MRELILNLHGVGEPHAAVDSNECRFWLSVKAFKDLLDQITHRKGDCDLKIAITFDDGNASDALIVLPELISRSLTADFFVCAGRIGSAEYLDRFMLRDLLDCGMGIGSHGINHQDWRTLTDRALDVELRDARHKLEDITQRSISTVAIPFGSYDHRVLRRLRRDTWECIYTTDGGFARNSERIRTRQPVDAAMYNKTLINELCTDPPVSTRLRRKVARLYKQFR